MNRIRHVLIALDATTSGRGALDVLALLMREAQADVVGLFVEDEAVARLASLPVAREVRLSSLPHEDARPMSGADVDTAWQQQAAQLRHVFDQRLTALQLRHSFEVRRGEPVRLIVEAAQTTELVIVERCVRAGVRFWAALHELAEQTTLPVLFVNEPWATGHNILLIGDGDDAATDAALLAAEFAARDRLPLLHVHSTPPPPTLRPQRWLPAAQRADAESLLALTRDANPRLLVLPRACFPDLAKLLPTLLRRLECSLLIV